MRAGPTSPQCSNDFVDLDLIDRIVGVSPSNPHARTGSAVLIQTYEHRCAPDPPALSAQMRIVHDEIKSYMYVIHQGRKPGVVTLVVKSKCLLLKRVVRAVVTWTLRSYMYGTCTKRLPTLWDRFGLSADPLQCTV